MLRNFWQNCRQLLAWLGLIGFSASWPITAHTAPSGRATARRICVVAVRDMQLFEPCKEIPSPMRRCPEDGGFRLPRAFMRLSQAVLSSPHCRTVLERYKPLLFSSETAQPDPDVKNRVEKEFRRRKEFLLVRSPEEADLVFLVEARYVSRFPERAHSSDRNGFLLKAAAVAVPSVVYRQQPIDVSDLLRTAVWAGAETSSAGELTDAEPARPENLVRRFAGRRKEPAAPLCPGAGHALGNRVARPQHQRWKAVLQSRQVPVSGTQLLAGNAAAPEGTIKVDVALVTVPVSVTDGEGKSITNLKYSDFHLFEDGVAQKIAYVRPVTEPFDVALLLDTSDSMRFKLDEIREAALSFVNAMRPEDGVLVVSFDNAIYVDSELTSGRDQLRQAILQTRTGGGTRLFDALELVMTERLRKFAGRKAIVLFTDGVDTLSRFSTYDDALERIEECGALGYVIQYDTQMEVLSASASSKFLAQSMAGTSDEEYARGRQFLKELSERAGGRLYRAGTLGNLHSALTQIVEELGREYTLCYYPSNPATDGSYRHIRVSVERTGARVRARPGYRAAARTN